MSNDLLRRRFDAAFRLKEEEQGHLPALFHSHGAILGYEGLHRTLASRRPIASGAPTQSTAAFPWARCADLAIAGLSLLAVAGLAGRRLPIAYPAGLLLLASIFLMGGYAKLADPWAFTRQVRAMTVLPSGSAQIAWLLGPLETGVGLSLLFPRWRWCGLLAATALLSGFGLVVVASLASGYAGSCGCLPWRADVGWWTLARGAALVGRCSVLWTTGAVSEKHPARRWPHEARRGVPKQRSP